MKKTAFLLVLALLLQILLPPSMAGNVYAASTEEVAASVQEQTASIEEFNASLSKMSELADGMKDNVRKFKYE